MNRHRFESMQATAVACAALTTAVLAMPVRADSYDWWLFDQIGLTMNQRMATTPATATATMKNPKRQESAHGSLAGPLAPSGEPALQRGAGDVGSVESVRPVASGSAPGETQPEKSR